MASPGDAVFPAAFVTPGFVAAASSAGDLSSALISSMSAIGVTPAIGSLENSPMRNASAPASLPSRYTGLPLMPATTPVYSAFSPCSRIKMMLPLGPFTLCKTPRTSTPMDSGLTPSKTVRA